MHSLVVHRTCEVVSWHAPVWRVRVRVDGAAAGDCMATSEREASEWLQNHLRMLVVRNRYPRPAPRAQPTRPVDVALFAL